MPAFDNWPDADRLSAAKERTGKLVDHILHLFMLHEANAIITYSDRLSRQIPRSFAAHAFNQFQTSMHLFELIRLCALWDPVRDDRESVPTIIALIAKPTIIAQCVDDTRNYFANEPPPAGEDEIGRALWLRERPERATCEANQAEQYLSTSIERAKVIMTSPEIAALRDFRNRYIAHNLPGRSLEETSEAVRLPRYQEEKKILEETVEIANHLHLALNRTGLDWIGARKISRNNAEALWHGCTFQVQR